MFTTGRLKHLEDEKVKKKNTQREEKAKEKRKTKRKKSLRSVSVVVIFFFFLFCPHELRETDVGRLMLLQMGSRGQTKSGKEEVSAYDPKSQEGA